jgi:hypothetical protein
MLAAPGGGGGAFDGISEAVSGIVAASDAGFMVSENGGQPLLDAIRDLQREVATALARADFLQQQPPLGTTPNAVIYKPFLSTIASDPSQGAIPVLRQLQRDLLSAEAAIKKAMANYQEGERANTATIKGTLT